MLVFFIMKANPKSNIKGLRKKTILEKLKTKIQRPESDAYDVRKCRNNISTNNTALSSSTSAAHSWKCIQPALRCLCASIHGSPREARSAGTGIRRALWHIHSGNLPALLGKPGKISSVFNNSCFHLPASIHPKYLLCALCKRMRAPSHSLHDLSGAGIFRDKRRVISIPCANIIFLATDIQLWSWIPEESQLLKNKMQNPLFSSAFSIIITIATTTKPSLLGLKEKLQILYCGYTQNL